MIKLSIIIPHYNDSKRLKRLLDTIPLNEETEVLVIDDNSDIAEQEIAKGITTEHSANSYFFVNKNKESHSAGACRNIGLDHATGEWVLFSDADDFFTEDIYESVCRYFDSDYDVVFWGTTSRSETTGELSERHKTSNRLVNEFCDNPQKETELNLRYHHYTPWGKLIRKKLIDENGIRFEEIRYSNDLLFSTKVGFYAKEIHADRRVIYCVTSSDGTLTKIKNRESFDIRKQALIRRYSFLYHSISKEDMRIIGLKNAGLRYVLSPVRNGYGLKPAVAYYKLLKELGVPLSI